MTPEAAAAILNVSSTASRAEVDAAFRLRARMSHPDRFAGASAGDIQAATAEFVRVGRARDVLHGVRPAPTFHANPPRSAPHSSAPNPDRSPPAGGSRGSTSTPLRPAPDTLPYHPGVLVGFTASVIATLLSTAVIVGVFALAVALLITAISLATMDRHRTRGRGLAIVAIVSCCIAGLFAIDFTAFYIVRGEFLPGAW